MMTKKTGQIITAFIIGLLLIVTTRTIFAQEPVSCGNVVVSVYNVSNLGDYPAGSPFGGPPLVTITNASNIIAANPAYATVSNIHLNQYTPISMRFASTLYPSGISRTVVITSFFSSANAGGDLNGFELISSTGVYTNAWVGWNVPGGDGTVLNGTRFQLDDNYGGNPGYQTFTFYNVPGDVTGVLLAMGNNDPLEFGWAKVGRWTATALCYTSFGGGGDCTTVTDADFTGSPDYDNGGWYQDYGVTIHGGYLDIAPFDVTPGDGETYQEFTPNAQTYTATMMARSANTNTTQVHIGIMDTSWRGSYIGITVTETANEDFGIYTFTLTNSITPGDLSNLLLYAGDEGVQIDYLCLLSDNGVCVNPSEIDFTYGNNLNTWSGLAMDDSFSTPLFRRLNIGLMNSEDELPLGGWAQEITTSSFNNIASVINAVTGAYIKSPYLIERALAGFQDSIDSRYDAASLQMSGKATLSDMSVEFVWPYNMKTVNFTVLAFVGDEWIPVGNTTINHGDEGFLYNLQGKWSVENINLSLQMVDSPTSYILLSTISADAELSILSPATQFYITGISITGCYSGDAYISACVVSDPTLDGGAAGGPDDYFWHWENANVEAGQITLSAESRSELSQNVYTPSPGAYQLTVGLINDTSDRCELYARGADETGYTQNDFFNVLLPCVNSTAIQTVTVDVMLPDDQFDFILSANKGHATVTDICFSLPGSDLCINKNPEFTDGSTGYDGGFTVENGHIILNPATMINAVPNPTTPFYTGKGPWMLQVTASPAATGTSVLAAITPGLNPVDTTIPANDYYPISNTQVLTYAISLTDDDQRALTMTGNGPSVYNNGATGRMAISKYCLMTDTGTTWWGNKDCTTVTNPDFINGLTGWTASSAVGVGGWAVLDTNGSVRQTVGIDNLIINPDFEVNTTGWAESDGGNCGTFARSSEQAKIGSYSTKITRTCNSDYFYYTTITAPSATTYSYGIWIKTTSTYFMYVAQTNSSTLIGTEIVGNGQWQFVSVTMPATSGTVDLFFSIAIRGAPTTTYVDGAVLVAGSSIPVQYSTPQEATVHWIAKSGTTSDITATVSVSSTAGVFSTSQVVGPAIEEFFTPFNVGGDVEVRVAGTIAGLELDFVCLNSGTYTEGPDGEGGPGTWTPGVGDGRCAAPPMAILTNTLSAWMPNIWIWSNQPTNYEVVSVYSAAWLRYIGCTLTDLQKMLEVKLNTIIEKLGTGTGTNWAEAIARIFEAIEGMIDSIAGVISQLLTLLITIWNSLAPGLGLVWQLMATLLELLQMIIRLLADFAGWLLQMVMTMAGILFNFIADSATLPGEMMTAYNNAINDPAYDIIPLGTVPGGEMNARTIDIDCSVPDSNYWCGILFGFQVVNQTIGASILYPMVIIGLILSTIFVFKNQLWEYYNVKVK